MGAIEASAFLRDTLQEVCVPHTDLLGRMMFDDTSDSLAKYAGKFNLPSVLRKPNEPIGISCD